MHGGVAAFVADSVVAVGAYIASGFKRVAGVQLSINFIRPAFLGDQIEVEATRLQLGKTIQRSPNSKETEVCRRMDGSPSMPHNQTIPAAVTAKFDPPLYNLGFRYTHLSREKITGHLTVNESCLEPFKVMHGGVAAFEADSVAGVGAYIASGFKRVAGVQLSINFIRPAFLADQIEVEATRLQLGKTIQVWEVQQWKTNTISDEKVLLSSSKVTLLCNLPLSKEMKSFEDVIMKYAKL